MEGKLIGKPSSYSLLVSSCPTNIARLTGLAMGPSALASDPTETQLYILVFAHGNINFLSRYAKPVTCDQMIFSVYPYEIVTNDSIRLFGKFDFRIIRTNILIIVSPK